MGRWSRGNGDRHNDDGDVNNARKTLRPSIHSARRGSTAAAAAKAAPPEPVHARGIQLRPHALDSMILELALIYFFSLSFLYTQFVDTATPALPDTTRRYINTAPASPTKARQNAHVSIGGGRGGYR